MEQKMKLIEFITPQGEVRIVNTDAVKAIIPDGDNFAIVLSAAIIYTVVGTKEEILSKLTERKFLDVTAHDVKVIREINLGEKHKKVKKVMKPKKAEKTKPVVKIKNKSKEYTKAKALVKAKPKKK